MQLLYRHSLVESGMAAAAIITGSEGHDKSRDGVVEEPTRWVKSLSTSSTECLHKGERLSFPFIYKNDRRHPRSRKPQEGQEKRSCFWERNHRSTWVFFFPLFSSALVFIYAKNGLRVSCLTHSAFVSDKPAFLVSSSRQGFTF